MKRALRHPLFWLTVQLAVVLVAAAVAGGLRYTRVPDTPSYLNAATADSLSESLSHYRTAGYPLFLRLVTGAGRWLEPVPAIQIALFSASLYLFWFAVARFSGSRWLAWAAVVPLPWAGVMNLASYIQPDFLSAAAAIAAISCLLLLVADRSPTTVWVGLGASVFCAYQLRPATVFLVAFIPLSGLALKWLVAGRGPRRLARWTLGLTLVTAAPLLLFCGLRWATVGHFGLVSFGGMNLAGLAANFLDGRLVKELSGENRDLAKAMLRQRRKRGWEPMRRDSDPVEHFTQYSDNIWRVALPVARNQHRKLQQRRFAAEEHPWIRSRPPTVVQNEMLTAVSRAILRSRPSLYGRWVRHALVYGIRQLSDYVWILVLFLLNLVSLPILLLRQRGAEAPGGLQPPGTVAVLAGLSILGVGYFCSYLLLVSLVSFPFARYLVSMTLFLPSVLSVQLFAVWSRICSSLAQSPMSQTSH